MPRAAGVEPAHISDKRLIVTASLIGGGVLLLLVLGMLISTVWPRLRATIAGASDVFNEKIELPGTIDVAVASTPAILLPAHGRIWTSRDNRCEGWLPGISIADSASEQRRLGTHNVTTTSSVSLDKTGMYALTDFLVPDGVADVELLKLAEEEFVHRGKSVTPSSLHKRRTTRLGLYAGVDTSYDAKAINGNPILARVVFYAVDGVGYELTYTGPGDHSDVDTFFRAFRLKRTSTPGLVIRGTSSSPSIVSPLTAPNGVTSQHHGRDGVPSRRDESTSLPTTANSGAAFSSPRTWQPPTTTSSVASPTSAPAIPFPQPAEPVRSEPPVETIELSQGKESKAWAVEVDAVAEPIVIQAPKKAILSPGFVEYRFPTRPSPFVAILSRDQNWCRLVDLRTQQEVSEIECEISLADEHLPSPDGKYLAIYDNNDRTHKGSVWSFEDRSLLFHIPPVVSHAISCGWAKSDLLLLSETGSSAFAIARVDVKNQRTLPTIKIPWRNSRSRVGFDVSPGGLYLAVLLDRTLYVLDAASGELKGEAHLPIPYDPSTRRAVECDGLRFSPDGRLLLAVCELYQRIFCWDVATGKLLVNRPLVRRPAVDAPSHGERPLIDWFPEKTAWMLGKDLLMESRTGTPVWKFPNDYSRAQKLFGLDAMLVKETETVSGEFESRLVAKQLPKSELSNALKVARTAPSENSPTLTDTDGSQAQIIRAAIDAPWSYEPDALIVDRPQPVLKVTGASLLGRQARLFLPIAAPSLVVTHDVLPQNDSVMHRDGPREPQIRSLLCVYDVTKQKPTAELEITGWSKASDVSPDGTLVLTHDPIVSRVDVWAPDLGKHAVGWDPVLADPKNSAGKVDWATFADKLHVLSHVGQQLVLWRLPACQAVYAIPDFGRVVALSPTKKYIVGAKQEEFFVYETLTGRCAGKLELPSGKNLFPIGWFRPDGEVLVVTSTEHSYTRVTVFEMRSGRIQTHFGTSTIHPESAEWIDMRHLLLQVYPAENGPRYLLDLESRALVCRYDDRGHALIHNAGRMDGRVWLNSGGPASGGINFALQERDFPLPTSPARLEDHAIHAPGMPVGLRVDSDVVDVDLFRTEFAEHLGKLGYTVSPAAPNQLVLKISNPSVSRSDGRMVATDALTFELSCDVGGKTQWRQQSSRHRGRLVTTNGGPQPSRQELQEEVRVTVAGLPTPEYLFPSVDELKLPIQTFVTPTTNRR